MNPNHITPCHLCLERYGQRAELKDERASGERLPTNGAQVRRARECPAGLALDDRAGDFLIDLQVPTSRVGEAGPELCFG